MELGTSFYNQRISSKDFVVLNLGHATWATFSLLRDENVVFLRCFKLSERDNFGSRNWLQVIYDVI